MVGALAGSVTVRLTGESPSAGVSSCSTTRRNSSATALAIAAASSASSSVTVMSICELSSGLSAETRARSCATDVVRSMSWMTGPRTASLRATSG
ncbi:hypothetical protein JKP76_01700 [Blastococcus sp. TML/C7B]|uniref:hypothetical protein n=1 Tax=Blastococcus sp. TML/C7B TaxID=2798728 RepID=UPI00190CBF45|nr:hypothetical protein [Blastococcus sp. TML/C7B]MBN1094884.1 hypothetical protein [Blastococcus sp. TML/C7B]